MSEVSPVTVSLDNRVRLLAAVLATSHWPELEQAQAPHAVHTQSKLTKLAMSAAFPEPPAATATVNAALAAGVGLGDLFTAALCGRWPDFWEEEPLPATLSHTDLLRHLADCAAQVELETGLWAEQEVVWHEAKADLEAIFHNTPLPDFLGRALGRPLTKAITIVPTLVYPMLNSAVAETAAHLTLIIPPPKAWGESPPWPYRDGHDVVLAETCRELLHHLLADELRTRPAHEVELLKHAAATLFLEEALTDGEGMSYLVRAKRQYSLPELPATVERLRPLLQNGRGILGQ
ncbi:MAG: hypothetical protein IPL28_01450 [Chloroflexi bacterium]|nr:hypothetical protein [Chloroflexota bacterium]